MQKQIELRYKERQLLDHEVDTSSIDEMFQIYEALGGLGKESMQNEIINDFHLLEEIVGELDYENMEMLRFQNPNVYLMMLFKIVAMLGYFAKIPTNDANGN